MIAATTRASITTAIAVTAIAAPTTATTATVTMTTATITITTEATAADVEEAAVATTIAVDVAAGAITEETITNHFLGQTAAFYCRLFSIVVYLYYPQKQRYSRNQK